MTALSRRRSFALMGAVACGFAPAAGAVEPTAAKPSYISLGEFTVNLPQNPDGLGYLVIDLTLDAVPSDATSLVDIRPRLKEAVIRELMVLASKGTLRPGQTDPLALKALLLGSLQHYSPGAIRDVLITRLLYG